MGKSVIDIDDELLDKARKLTGLKRKGDIVKLALDSLVRQKNIEGILDLKGKIRWEGDLALMRKDKGIPHAPNSV